MSNLLSQYYRCCDEDIPLFLPEPLSGDSGYFKFQENILYGRLSDGETSTSPTLHSTKDALAGVAVRDGAIVLPFDPAEVASCLRSEAYTHPTGEAHPASSLLGRSYYFLRPALPIAVRRHLQKFRLNGWRQLRFPNWPVDRTVDALHEQLLLLSLRAANRQEIPFIWFWPNGASSCAILTHDVETVAGRDFCSSLMDVDDEFGVKASFQVVPESRYEVPESYLGCIRNRGFEIDVQDLNHDGRLFRERDEFLARVRKINEYGRKYRAEGFRAAVLYRRQEWYESFEFSYDMSVPNVAHLDPQRGGCCTVMPYFVGKLVELPVTATQDYSLFHILRDHSIELWKQQIDLIMEKHGLMNFIIHPDYVIGQKEMETYKALLTYLAQLAADKNVWMPLPKEVASWWRDRANMRLVGANGRWRVEGKGSERARIAYASEKDGKLSYSFQSLSESTQTGLLTSRPN